MVTVEHLIGELLLRHNCVIIPSFGGFVAKQASASIDYRNGLISPPKKSVLFNRQLINNDGLLIAELAVQNSIHYNDATNAVREIVDKWNNQLRNGERITIDKVGFLFFDQEKNICFEQDRFFNLLLESYGLGKVHFLTESDVQLVQKTTIEKAMNESEKTNAQPAIVFDTEKEAQKTLQAEPVVLEHPALKSKTKVWRYVAAACFLPIAFYSFWLPMKTNVLQSGVVTLNDFNPFQKSQPASSVNALKEGTHQTMTFNLDNAISVVNDKYNERPYNLAGDFDFITNYDASADVVESNNETPTAQAFSREYIVGCFSSQENANKLIQSLKQQGVNAYILDVTNGLHRISAGGANSETELQAVISTVQAAGQQGWILKK
jgi:hypothetical protein